MKIPSITEVFSGFMLSIGIVGFLYIGSTFVVMLVWFLASSFNISEALFAPMAMIMIFYDYPWFAILCGLMYGFVVLFELGLMFVDDTQNTKERSSEDVMVFDFDGEDD